MFLALLVHPRSLNERLDPGCYTESLPDGEFFLATLSMAPSLHPALPTIAHHLFIPIFALFCSLFRISPLYKFYDTSAFERLCYSGFHLTVERDWFWFWFWFYYALWLASVFTLVLVLRQSSENRSNTDDQTSFRFFWLLQGTFNISHAHHFQFGDKISTLWRSLSANMRTIDSTPSLRLQLTIKKPDTSSSETDSQSQSRGCPS